jgi:hypothetical protein
MVNAMLVKLDDIDEILERLEADFWCFSSVSHYSRDGPGTPAIQVRGPRHAEPRVMGAHIGRSRRPGIENLI